MADVKLVEKLSAGGAWRFGNKIFGGLTSLPPVIAKATVQQAVVNLMRDGCTLRSDVYIAVPIFPQADPGLYPTILIRTPYNRKFVAALGTTMAIRGFHVVIQDTRGTGDSEGCGEVLAFDHLDGQDTLRWLHQQEWFRRYPKVGTWGMSFLGIVQYAALSDGTPGDLQVDALLPCMCASNVYSVIRPEGGYSLSLLARWHHLTCRIKGDTSFAKLLAASMTLGKAEKAFSRPLCDYDCAITGKSEQTDFGKMCEDNVRAMAESDFWVTRNYSTRLVNAPPTHLIGGWYDIFFRELLNDYDRLVRMGKRVNLTIGPWIHFDTGPAMTALREGLWWFTDILKGGVPAVGGNLSHMEEPGSVRGSFQSHRGLAKLLPHRHQQQSSSFISANEHPEAPSMVPQPDSSLASGFLPKNDKFDLTGVVKPAPFRRVRKPVMLYIMGGGGWREFDTWPPQNVHPTPLYHVGGGAMMFPQETLPPDWQSAQSPPDRFTYDPLDPPPTVGGADFGPKAGRADNRMLEKRSDVLVYTTGKLAGNVCVVGFVSMILYYQSTSEHLDFVTRMTRVSGRRDKSEVICEGYVRITPDANVIQRMPDGTCRVVVDMWATGIIFRKGERIRVCVSGGSYPRFLKSYGTETDIWTANPTEVGQKVGVKLFHDSRHASRLILPIIPDLEAPQGTAR